MSNLSAHECSRGALVLGSVGMEDGMTAQDLIPPCRRSSGLARLFCLHAHTQTAPAPAALGKLQWRTWCSSCAWGSPTGAQEKPT